LLSILIPALAPQCWGGTCAAGQRLSAGLVFWLHFPRVTVFWEITTEGKRQRAVNNLKKYSDFLFLWEPPFAERVQQQTGILPWRGLTFRSESNNKL